MEFFNFLVGGGDGSAASAAGAGSLMSMLPFVLIIGIFYLFIIRPQNKKQKETKLMIEGARKGDKVVTIGGIHGTISSTDEKTVTIKVDDNTKLKINRSAIGSIVVDKVQPEDKDKKDDKKEDKKLEKAAKADKASKAEPEASSDEKQEKDEATNA
jgi:preprotein translocase subunit YajC